jgi:hypothetical protein
VIIESQGPKVSNITFDAKHGTINITYQDNVGLNLASLRNTADYTITQGSKRLTPNSIADLGGVGVNQDTIQIKINKGKKLNPAKYTVSVDSGHVSNLAGNNLDGEFNGAFPSGNGVAGGSFRAAFTVKTRGPVKGPAPAVVVGGVHPLNLSAHSLTAASVSQSGAKKAIHSAALGGFHLSKAYPHHH